MWVLDSDFVSGFTTFKKCFKNWTSFVVGNMIAHAKGTLGWTAFVFRLQKPVK